MSHHLPAFRIGADAQMAVYSVWGENLELCPGQMEVWGCLCLLSGEQKFMFSCLTPGSLILAKWKYTQEFVFLSVNTEFESQIVVFFFKSDTYEVEVDRRFADYKKVSTHSKIFPKYYLQSHITIKINTLINTWSYQI